jgi:hypothetical protein
MKSSKLPIQSAPVERIATGATMSDRGGVDPSILPIDWASIMKPMIIDENPYSHMLPF